MNIQDLAQPQRFIFHPLHSSFRYINSLMQLFWKSGKYKHILCKGHTKKHYRCSYEWDYLNIQQSYLLSKLTSKFKNNCSSRIWSWELLNASKTYWASLTQFDLTAHSAYRNCQVNYSLKQQYNVLWIFLYLNSVYGTQRNPTVY